ncbi:MAG: AAA family ATPase, partial [Armatimonadota bacterium]
MRIANVEIRNFRSIRNANFDVSNVFALVGRNNSGKSNFVKGLSLFFDDSIRAVDQEC